MAILGVLFVAIGVLAEALLGTWFKQFFNPSYPHDVPRWDDERIKLRLGRILLCLGVVLLLLDGARLLID